MSERQSEPVRDSDELDAVDNLAPVVHAEAIDWLASHATGSAGAVILDPPYSVRTASSYRSREDGSAGSVFGPFSLMGRAMAEAERVLSDGCCAVVFADWRRMSDLAYLGSLLGLRTAACVAWVRSTIGTGGLFRSQWDPILLLSKGNPRVRDKSGIPNVVSANKPRGEHPYAKPVEVYRHVLGRICEPGELVLDPFAGSAGSRGAALGLGLRWAGCDIDPAYAEVTEMTDYPNHFCDSCGVLRPRPDLEAARIEAGVTIGWRCLTPCGQPEGPTSLSGSSPAQIDGASDE